MAVRVGLGGNKLRYPFLVVSWLSKVKNNMVCLTKHKTIETHQFCALRAQGVVSAVESDDIEQCAVSAGKAKERIEICGRGVTYFPSQKSEIRIMYSKNRSR